MEVFISSRIGSKANAHVDMVSVHQNRIQEFEAYKASEQKKIDEQNGLIENKTKALAEREKALDVERKEYKQRVMKEIAAQK